MTTKATMINKSICGGFIFLLLLSLLCGCQMKGVEVNQKGTGTVGEPEVQTESEVEIYQEPKTIALVLSSMDGTDNEEIIKAFEEASQTAGAELLVKIPEVSAKMAEESRTLTGDFILMDQDPIELQMLIINELVMEKVDVIAIDANHPDALEPVLYAARKAGIRVCAFGQTVNENCCEVYAETNEAPQTAVGLLNIK